MNKLQIKVGTYLATLGTLKQKRNVAPKTNTSSCNYQYYEGNVEATNIPA